MTTFGEDERVRYAIEKVRAAKERRRRSNRTTSVSGIAADQHQACWPRWYSRPCPPPIIVSVMSCPLTRTRASVPRISSQAIANWLRHGLVSRGQVVEVFERMALVADQQNADDATYIPMSSNFGSIAFWAARDLVFKGADQPSGCTEPLLHSAREKVKAHGEAVSVSHWG
jgi:hypothetical protein